MAGRRILIVDDEPYICRILAFKLRRAGYLTVEAASAEDALAALAAQPVDLVLLDVGLATPTDGFALARRLAAEPSTAALPVILLTAHALAADVRQGHEVGAAGYITKPFSADEVLERVATILAAP